MEDPFGLRRFLEAQDGVYAAALGEIRDGRKRTHWMWFVFPQIAGLGRSGMAVRYAIAGAEEARAYAAHRVLGARYRECVGALQLLAVADAEEVFGGIDATKLRSSLTLFAEAAPEALLEEALERWFRGERDRATMELLEGK